MATYTFEGWLGKSPEAAQGKMEWGSFEPKRWTQNDVDIQVSHCGICGSDMHTLRSGWGETPYRMLQPLGIPHPLLALYPQTMFLLAAPVTVPRANSLNQPAASATKSSGRPSVSGPTSSTSDRAIALASGPRHGRVSNPTAPSVPQGRRTIALAAL